MKYFKIYILAVLAIMAVSCEDKLEIQPRQSIAGELAITSESNISNILIGTYDEAGQAASYGGRIQAKFLRALTYFDLLRHFAAEGKGVPIRTEGILDYAVDLSIARSSEADGYALVLSDLQDAIALLPESNTYFADKYGAEALLARVYLDQGNFAGARDAAHNVITSSGRSLAGSIPAAFNHDSNDSEDVFAFQVTSQTGSNNLITFHASEGNGGRGGDISVNQEFLDLFDDSADARANFFYTSPETGGRLTSKYTNQFANIQLIRIAEMHLIRAEGNFEEGTSVGIAPLDDLNLLRIRAAAAPVSIPVTKDKILKERILELAFEGFAIHDVVRTQGSVDGFAYNANELTFPIPQSEMDTNSLMEQNPGYQ